MPEELEWLQPPQWLQDWLYTAVVGVAESHEFEDISAIVIARARTVVNGARISRSTARRWFDDLLGADKRSSKELYDALGGGLMRAWLIVQLFQGREDLSRGGRQDLRSAERIVAGMERGSDRS